jgi:hypothetical protein
MTDFNTIRVIPLCGKADEWPIWNEKLLAKAKRYGFKDLLLGKLSIPKADDKIDQVSYIGKKMAKTIELNEIAYTEHSSSPLMLKLVMLRLRSILSKDVRARIILMGMHLLIGRSSRTSMNLYPPLL